MKRNLLAEAYEEVRQGSLTQPTREVMPGALTGPKQTTEPEPEPENNTFDIIIDAVDLGDLIHTLREFFKSLSPEQQNLMADYFRDRLSPQMEAVAGLANPGIIMGAGQPMTGGMGSAQQNGMTTRAKILGLPPGQSTRNFPVKINGVYRIVDRTTETVTIVGDDGRKLTFPKHLVQPV